MVTSAAAEVPLLTAGVVIKQIRETFFWLPRSSALRYTYVSPTHRKLLISQRDDNVGQERRSLTKQILKDLCVTKSAPAWEQVRTLQRPIGRRAAGAAEWHSHAGAWDQNTANEYNRDFTWHFISSIKKPTDSHARLQT